MTEADLILAVRAGISSTVGMAEVDDVDIQRHYPWILSRIGEKITIRTLRYVTSVANQREYSIPDAVLRVVKVYKWDSSYGNYLTFSDLGASHRKNSSIDGANEYYRFPSIWAIESMERIRGLSRTRHEFDPINRKLRIDPYPTEAGLKYYYTSADKTKWTLGALPEDMEEVVVMGVIWKCVEQLVMARSELGGVMREGGRVTYPASELWNIAKDMKTDFYDELDTKSMIYSR